MDNSGFLTFFQPTRQGEAARDPQHLHGTVPSNQVVVDVETRGLFKMWLETPESFLVETLEILPKVDVELILKLIYSGGLLELLARKVLNRYSLAHLRQHRSLVLARLRALRTRAR